MFVKNRVPGEEAPVVIFVSHGRCLRYLVSSITGVTVEMKNTAVSRLDWCGGSEWHTGYLNDSSHVAGNATALFND